jgi:Cu/Zn superoxide dismutase
LLEGVKPSELWGRALIVHADEDDLGQGGHIDSKVTGHSGDRIGCAIFGRASCS